MFCKILHLLGRADDGSQFPLVVRGGLVDLVSKCVQYFPLRLFSLCRPRQCRSWWNHGRLDLEKCRILQKNLFVFYLNIFTVLTILKKKIWQQSIVIINIGNLGNNQITINIFIKHLFDFSCILLKKTTINYSFL